MTGLMKNQNPYYWVLVYKWFIRTVVQWRSCWLTSLRFKSESCPESLSCVTSLSSKSAVLHPGPHDPPPPPPDLTHLILITSSLEESSMNELCSDWHHVPYIVFTVLYSLHTGNRLKFTSLKNTDLRYSAASPHTDKTYSRSVKGYLTVIMRFAQKSSLVHFNSLWMEQWNNGRISCDVHFVGHLWSNGTNPWSGKRNIQNVQSGGSWGPGLRTAALNKS